ncbi:hypothetical protein D3Z39_15170 [Anaerotruncus colihominis]|uniref:Uncharacterized protein n=1 Tax=Anaerotruncus colihominis TaxID=169435 RepID=A0A845RJI0_9FIRM|nr:hypothetical protein [Anaerotruncus colihominis]
MKTYVLRDVPQKTVRENQTSKSFLFETDQTNGRAGTAGAACAFARRFAKRRALSKLTALRYTL